MNDYIRRKEVYQKLHDAGGCDASDEWSKGYDAAIDVAIEIIENMPSTADVVPIVHGHWIQLNADDQSCNEFVCSVCGHEIFHPTDFVEVEPLPKYCEECGAIMDESESEDNA